MHLHPFDPYRPYFSPIHRLDARSKLVLTVGFILTTALTPVGAWPVYVLLLSLLLAAAVLSQVGVGYVLRRSALSLPFILAALPLLFAQSGPPFWPVTIGPIQVHVSMPGLIRFLSVALRSWISVQAAILLTATTPIPGLLVGLRGLGMPALLVAVVGLMWRYLFVLGDEAVRLLQARSARSSRLPEDRDLPPGARRKRGGSLAWRAKVAGGMAGSLFLRSIERSDRIYHAMLARGYDGQVRAADQTHLAAMDKISLGLGVGTYLLLLLAGWLMRG
jgi:cobalt/nickel transport system permease protein